VWYFSGAMASWFLRFCFPISILIAPIALGAMQNQTDTPHAAARKQFQTLCSRCHGADGNGGEMGPPIVTSIVARSDAELTTVIRDGRPANGMPPFGAAIPESDMRPMVAFLRTLRPPRGASMPVKMTVETTDGKTIEGVALNRSLVDVQLLTSDNRIQLLRRTGDASSNSARFKPVTSQTDWTTYHGQMGGNRYSTVDEINTKNVGKLAPKWTFTIPDAARLEVTPIVIGGVMYVTAANEAFALDAGSGRRIWHYRRPRTKGLAGDAAAGINRGAAVSGDRLFMVTDHAHIIAINRFTGAMLWDTEMADYRQNYGATAAPLAVGDLVISGVSGGDEGIRGFVAAYDAATGKEAWRFWTVPARGEPGSETWKGKDIEHGCAATWLTGTFDASLDTLYWPTGNPCPDYDGAERIGDNLYSDSIIALDPKTGTLKWHFQYTPHDLWDWDAQQPPVLVDADWNGTPRKLLLHANRNGFFYVLDRTNGEFLLAKPFVKKLTWASGIDAQGRPIVNDNQKPSAGGMKVCPAVEGATNWFSTSFNPSTGLYYVQALEKCTIYTRSPSAWVAGQSFYSGTTRQAQDEPPQKVLRAIDIETGAIKWELPQTGPANSWGGTLTTAGGLVFFGEDSGALMAVEAATGTPLWHFQTNALWKASPMTYVFDHRQHIAVASGGTIMAFAIVD
jgi:alcohol dehydrogenase (cytochrome c)